MQLNVKNLAYQEVGDRETIALSFSREDFPEESGIEKVTGEVYLTRIDQGILAEFQVDLRVNLVCDRCLADFTFKPKLKFKQLYSLAPITDPDSEELPVSKNFEIDITSPIYQEAVLAIPVKKVCKSSCKGLCDHCGTDLNNGKCCCSKKEDKKV